MAALLDFALDGSMFEVHVAIYGYDLGSPPRACEKPFEIGPVQDAAARYLAQTCPAFQK